MEYVNCNLCGLDDTEILFSKKDKFSISKNDFGVVRCRKCGLIYVNPRPSEGKIFEFYPDIYSWKETLPTRSRISKWIKRLEKWYRYHLLRYEALKAVKMTGRKGGKLLDVGCGTGDRLNILRQLGFETCGIEVSLSSLRKHLTNLLE